MRTWVAKSCSLGKGRAAPVGVWRGHTSGPRMCWRWSPHPRYVCAQPSSSDTDTNPHHLHCQHLRYNHPVVPLFSISTPGSHSISRMQLFPLWLTTLTAGKQVPGACGPRATWPVPGPQSHLPLPTLPQLRPHLITVGRVCPQERSLPGDPTHSEGPTP